MPRFVLGADVINYPISYYYDLSHEDYDHSDDDFTRFNSHINYKKDI
jgi:hypothetical protein